MGKWVADSVLDAALDRIATATLMTACSQQPANRTEAVTTYKLADVAMSGVDFVKANGDVSGRKVTVAQKSGVTVDTTGTTNHVALSSTTELLYVTTCTPQVLTAGNTMTFSTWKIETRDPT